MMHRAVRLNGRFSLIVFCLISLIPAFALGVETSGAETSAVDLSQSGAATRRTAFTLVDAIALGLQRNLNMQTAHLDELSAAVDAIVSNEAFLPRIDSSLQKTVRPLTLDDPSSSASLKITKPLRSGGSASLTYSANDFIPGDSSSASNSVSFSLSQPLFSGGGDENLLSMRSNDLTLDIRRDSLEREAQKTIFTVTELYYSVIRRKLTLELTRRSVERAKTFLDMTVAREAAKQTSLLEVRNARVQLLRREIAELQAVKQLDGAVDALRRTLSLSADVPMDIPDMDMSLKPPAGQLVREFIIDESAGVVDVAYRAETDDETATPLFRSRLFSAQPFDEKTLIASALANRIEIINARRSIQIAEWTLDAKRSAAGQHLNYSVGYNRSGSSSSTFSDSLDLDSDSLSFGLNYSYQFGRASDLAAARKSQIALDRLWLAYDNQALGIEYEIRTLVRDIDEARRLVILNAYIAQQAQRALDANRIRFDRGLIDAYQVVNSEDDLLNAETDIVAQIISYSILTARATLASGEPTGLFLSPRRSRSELLDLSDPDAQ